MNQGLRGDGAGEDVDGDCPPPDERIVGDDFPLLEGSVPGRTAQLEPQIDSAKVPPRGGGVSSRKLAHDFFQGKHDDIAEDGRLRPTRRPRRQGACLIGGACLLDRVWAPWPISFAQKFLLIPKSCFVEFQDFWSCAEQVFNVCSFPSQNSSCRHPPSSW